MLGMLLSLSLIVSCSQPTQDQDDADIAAIKEVFHQQEKAWNNGDIPLFMEGYWKSDSVRFIGARGINYGWEKTLRNYEASYATPEEMGKLTFTILTLEKLSPTTAWMVGKWHLKRINDEPGGHYTLIWKKIEGHWVIVADHTS